MRHAVIRSEQEEPRSESSGLFRPGAVSHPIAHRCTLRKTLALISLLPIAAHAEVMDKELSFEAIILLALVGSVVAFFAARPKPWLLLILVPALCVLLLGHLAEIIDPFVGPAMAREAGHMYIVTSWLAPTLVLICIACGLFLRRRNIKG